MKIRWKYSPSIVDMKREAQDWQTLLDQARRDDEHADDAFAALFQAYLLPQVIFPCANKMLRDKADVEDVAQDIGEKLLTGKYYRQPTMATLEQLKKCVWRMTHNGCVNMIAHSSRRRFAVTDRSLEQLRLMAMPPDMLTRLQTLDPTPASKGKFLEMVRTALGAQSELFEEIILKACALNILRSVPISDAHFNAHSTERLLRQAEMEAREREALEAVRQILSEPEQQMIHWKFQGLTFDQMAQKLKTPLTTVHSRYQSLIKKIRANTQLYAYWEDYKASLNREESYM